MRPDGKSYVGSYVKVIHDFHTDLAGEVSLVKGEIYMVTNVVDKNWLCGSSRDKSGNFPTDFVDKIHLPSVTNGQKIFAAVENFPAQQTGDLNLSKGDIIVGLHQIDGNWWHGQVHGNTGMFPVTHVMELEIPSQLKQRSMSVHATETLFAQALVDAVGQLDDELSFQAGDIIKVTEVIDEDWYVGECRGKSGMFLSACVQLLNEDECCQSAPQESGSNRHMGVLGSQRSNLSGHDSSFQTNSNFHSLQSGQYLSGGDKRLKTVTEGVQKSNSLDRTTNLVSYTSENTKAHVGDKEAGVTPYARTLYPFNGEMPGELGFEANEIVTLIQHVDEEWIEGEIDGVIGLFPATYVEVIVDCPYAFHINDTDGFVHEVNTKKSCDTESNTQKDEKSNEAVHNHSAVPSMNDDKSVDSDLCESYALVLYTFTPETDADLCVTEGETVTLIKQIDDNWMLVRNEAGQTGMCPLTFLDVIGAPPTKQSHASVIHDTNDNEIKATENAQNTKDASSVKSVSEGVTQTPGSAIDHHNSYVTDTNNASKSSNKSIIHSNSRLTKPVLKPKPALTPKPQLKPKPLLTPKPVNTSQSGIKPVSFDPAVTMLKSSSVRCFSEIIAEQNGRQEGMSKAHSMYEINNHSEKAVSSTGSDFGSTGSNSSLNTSFESKKSASESSKSFKDLDLSKPLDSIIKDELVKARKEAELKSKRGSTISNESTGSSHRQFTQTSELERKASQSRASGNYSRENFESRLNVGNSTFYFDDSSSTSQKPPQFRKPPPPPMKSQKSEEFVRKPSLKKPAPPRPVGPRIAPAPLKTPLVPVAAIQSRTTPSRPAPARPGPLPTRPKSGALRRDRPAPPRPTGKTAGSDLMSFSPPNSTFYVEEEIETEKILGLRTQIANIEKDIQSVSKSKAELEERLGDTEIHDNIQFFTDNIQGLTSELTTLRERLAELCPQERNKIDAEKQAAARREQEARLREEQKQREAEVRVERMEKRQRVIQELVQTEKDFILSLSLIYETFLGPNAEKHADVDVDHLCGNMEEVAEVSQKLLTRLEEATQGKDFSQTVIGTCFVSLAEDMKNVYAPYCRNHDDVITLIEKYEQNPDVHAHIERQLDRLREDHTVFDLEALLIKPVQRILKYPLLLSELCKSTEDDHLDKMELLTAINAMTDVAQAINEYKRRKDLVYKYKKDTDVSLGDKLSKLSLHSIKKKSSRIKERFSVNLGIIDQTRDTLFDREETRYRHLEKSVRVFLRDVQSYVEEVQVVVNIQEGLSADIEDFYAEKRNVEEIHKYQVFCNTIHMTFLPNFQMEVDDLVVFPLTQLVNLFEGPDKVIQKRYDKLLDYDNLKRKAQSDKVFEKPMQAAKQNYEALNAQLLDDLPKMSDLATQLFRDCIGSFVRAQREFTDKMVHVMYTVTEQQLEFLSVEGIIDHFNIRHTAIVDRLAQLSFMPRAFSPRFADAKQEKKSKRMSLDSSLPMLKSTEAVAQMDSQRVYVTQQFSPGKLFRVSETHIAVDPMDISVCGGDVVGVIMEKDPMGNKERWFVDNGAMKGFIPRKLLLSYESSPSRPQSGSSPVLNLVSSTGSCQYSPRSTRSLGHQSPGSVNTLQSLQELDDMDFALEEEMVPDLADAGTPYGQPLYAGNQSLHAGNAGYQPQAADNAGHQHDGEVHYGSEGGMEDLQRKKNLYYAEYAFESRNENEVSLFEHQVVTVIAAHDENGNMEWWYVEADGHYGYAPASYLRPMDSHEQPT